MFGPAIEHLTFRERWQFVKSLFSVEIRRGIPRLILHEKYERTVKWALRAFALVGIIIGGVSFSAWYYGVAAAIGILAVQQFFERSVFEYTAILVTPMPFKYVPDQWISMAFGFARNRGNPDLVGPAFQDKSYAQEILDVMRSWNYQRPEDAENYIQLSFILEPNDQYSTYIYPSTRRPSSEKFFKDYENQQAIGKQGKRLMRLIFFFVFCKMFPLESDSLFLRFHERNSGLGPFLLTTFFQEGDSYTPLVDGAVLKFEYKCKRRDHLVKGEYEFMHGKKVMGHKKSI
jgi:hypothetical protein